MNEIRAVGFIGVGRVGAGMARNVMAGGVDLTVFDVNAAAPDALVADGAHAASSARAVAEAADVVSFVVYDEAQLRTALEGADGALAGSHPGQIFLVHSTVPPDVVVSLAALAESVGVELIDAGI